MRKDKVRTERNAKRETDLRGLIKNMRRTPSVEILSQTMSALDKAAKTNLIHKNKAARLKSRLAKKLSPQTKSA